MRHIILISGKDSLAAALVQREREPDLPYEYVFNETGWDLPESLAWIDKVEKHLGEPIKRCGDDLTEIVNEQGWLPSSVRRFCTRLAKIQPVNDYLGTAPATLYFGLRADEPNRVGYDPPKYQKNAYPLREAGMGLTAVWEFCQSVGLLPPQFRWEWMENRVRELLGNAQCLLDQRPEWERCSLLAWRTRNNCDRCFAARQYEKVGLWEHYPDLFEEACQMEEYHGRDKGSGTTYTWHPNYTMRSLKDRAGEIKERRARAIVKYLRKREQGFLFDEPLLDVLETTSCGLLCGK